MKFKMIISAAVALTVSSAAMASQDSGLGERRGRNVDYRGTQCERQEKPQADSSRDEGFDSDRSSRARTLTAN
jgi:hypothetical protein